VQKEPKIDCFDRVILCIYGEIAKFTRPNAAQSAPKLAESDQFNVFMRVKFVYIWRNSVKKRPK